MNAIILCPDCESETTIHVSRKHGKARVECSECGIIEEGIIDYGGGLVVGNN